MAGVKGRSGGARPNSGPKPKDLAASTIEDPAEFLTDVMQGKFRPSVEQLAAAKALLAAGSKGKKDQKQDAAKQVGAGKFGPAGAPLKLVSSA